MEDRRLHLLQGKRSQRAFLCPAACREFAPDRSKAAPGSVSRTAGADAETRRRFQRTAAGSGPPVARLI